MKNREEKKGVVVWNPGGRRKKGWHPSLTRKGGLWLLPESEGKKKTKVLVKKTQEPVGKRGLGEE